MTKAFPNIVRLLVVLAMVISMIAITVVPAGADVTAATVTPSPASASDAASYTVAFNVGGSGALVINVGTINITFPSGTTMPTSIAKERISVNGTVCAVDPSVSGQTVSLITPVGVANSGAVSVVISQVAGIKNPSFAGTTYKVQVNTSVESTLVNSSSYTITPSFSVSPTTAARGATVTVTGKGWAANQGITIGGSLSGTGTVLADGTFSVTAATVTSGNVTAADGSGKGSPGSGAGTIWTITNPAFTLKASVSVTPTSGNVGSTVTISGTDFTPTSNIPINGIDLGGVNWGPAALVTLATIDAFGVTDDFTTQLTIPLSATGGAKTVSVTDAAAKSATATFTVNTPTITVEPASGAPNSIVTVTGSNFGAADTITVDTSYAVGDVGLWLAPTAGSTSWNTVTITADASGGWTYSKLVPVTAVSGANPVIVKTTGGTTAAASFTVASRALTLTPSSGPTGTRVTVTGPNMTANGNIPLDTSYAVGDAGLWFAPSLTNASWNTAQISIDTQGNISPTTVTVPSTAATGANLVTAKDSGGLVATGTFTVTQPTIEISPSSGYLGDMVTVTGAGWVTGTLGLVTVQFNSVTQAVTTPDASGAWTASFQIPSNAVSGQLVSASDSLGNTAPSKAFLISASAITLDPTTGPPGTVVTVSGQGFLPLSAISTLTIASANVLPSAPVITDSLGSFNTTFTVPGLAAGAQTVNVNIAGTPASGFFTISAAEATVANVTSNIASQLVRVWGYTPTDGWQMYDPADPIGSDLATLTDGRGYWVNVTEATTLIYLGKSRVLDAGWNMMGW